MPRRTLAEWLRWQESLNPRAIDLSLERVRAVAARLAVAPPRGAVFTVAGTNGKGSTATLLHDVLRAGGRRPGLYTSPHLLQYRERIRIDGAPVDEARLLDAFECIEEARAVVPLTYFEYGTLAAFLSFADAGCDSWVLEVGMGGRLDAVNAVDADYALITTVALDHEEWLGETVEEIAAEKAGILRETRPAFYGDTPVPAAIRAAAVRLGTPLHAFGESFGYARRGDGWDWWTAGGQRLDGLPAPAHWTPAQYRNGSLALAALSAADQLRGVGRPALDRVVATSRPPGRFQIIARDPVWVLDVAHNPQAAEVLAAQLETQAVPGTTTVVVSLLADKAVTAFVRALAPVAQRWIVCPVDDPRSSDRQRMMNGLVTAGVTTASWADGPEEAFARAAALTPTGGRIVVCGSFRLVAPALGWLGLY